MEVEKNDCEYWHFISSSLHTITSISDIISKCPADLNQNRPSKVLTHADDMLTYKTSRDTQEVAKQCNNNGIMYSTGTMTPDLSSTQINLYKHCGAFLMTEQQAM